MGIIKVNALNNLDLTHKDLPKAHVIIDNYVKSVYCTVST